MKKKIKKILSSTAVSSLVLSLVACNSNINFQNFDNVAVNDINQVNNVQISSVPGELIIKRKKGSKSISILAPGMKAVRTIKKLGVEVVEVPPSNSMSSVISKLKKQSDIEYVAPNYIRKVVVPKRKFKKKSLINSLARRSDNLVNDPLRKDQYALDKILAEKAWKLNKGKSSVVVAIVDTGIDLGHPDLKNKLVKGFSVFDDKVGKDDNGHGTHCAGIAAASVNNGVGIAGIAANSKLMPIKVLDASGSGDDAGIIEGIIWAADHGADVISMSLGGPGTSEAFEEAVKYALEKNVVVVAAMGNDGQNIENYPAASKGVIAVGSTDQNDKISDFSNFGDWISVSAPGSEILSTFPTYNVDLNDYGFPQNYASLDGTSMSTPYVAGLSALILSKYGKLSPTQVKNILEKTSDDLGSKGFDKYFGHGRINAFKALSYK